MATTEKIIKTFEKYFKANKLNHELYADKAIRTIFILKEDTIVETAVFFYDDGFTVNSSLEETVPAEDIAAVSEAVLTINCALKRGHFNVYPETGKMSYHLWHPNKGTVSEKDIEYVLQLSIGSIEMILDTLDSIIIDKHSVEDAVNLFLGVEKEDGEGAEE